MFIIFQLTDCRRFGSVANKVASVTNNVASTVTPIRTTAQRARKSFPQKRQHSPERRGNSNNDYNETPSPVLTATTRKTAQIIRESVSPVRTASPERIENFTPLSNNFENGEDDETPLALQQKPFLEDSDEDDGN